MSFSSSRTSAWKPCVSRALAGSGSGRGLCSDSMARHPGKRGTGVLAQRGHLGNGGGIFKQRVPQKGTYGSGVGGRGAPGGGWRGEVAGVGGDGTRGGRPARRP